jgi:hypothetical protein
MDGIRDSVNEGNPEEAHIVKPISKEGGHC